MTFYASGAAFVSGAADVVLGVDKGFNGADVGFSNGAELLKLDEPKLLNSVQSMRVFDGVGKGAIPIFPQMLNKIRLADFLFAVQDRAILKVATGVKDTSDCAEEPFESDFADIIGIIGAEEIDEKSFSAFGTVPRRQVIEKVFNVVEGTPSRIVNDELPDKLSANQFVIVPAQIGLQLSLVAVFEFVALFNPVVPRRSFQENVGLLKEVVSKESVKVGIVREDKVAISYGSFNVGRVAEFVMFPIAQIAQSLNNGVVALVGTWLFGKSQKVIESIATEIILCGTGGKSFFFSGFFNLRGVQSELIFLVFIGKEGGVFGNCGFKVANTDISQSGNVGIGRSNQIRALLLDLRNDFLSVGFSVGKSREERNGSLFDEIISFAHCKEVSRTRGVDDSGGNSSVDKESLSLAQISKDSGINGAVVFLPEGGFFFKSPCGVGV